MDGFPRLWCVLQAKVRSRFHQLTPKLVYQSRYSTFRCHTKTIAIQNKDQRKTMTTLVVILTAAAAGYSKEKKADE